MIKSLLDAELRDGLPRVLQKQPWVEALSRAVLDLHRQTMGFIDGSQIYTAIDTVSEAVLDALAVSWKIDWYDPEYDLEQKRRIVQTALTIRRTMGTAAAVKAQADAIYPGSTVEEWYEYGGKPGYFRLRVNIMTVEEQEKFAAMSMAEIERRLAAAKRFSSHLEEVEYYDAGGTATGWGFAAYVGGELVESCTTIRVNPSPDDQKGTATAFALAACVGGILTEYGTTEQKEEALWPGSE